MENFSEGYLIQIVSALVSAIVAGIILALKKIDFTSWISREIRARKTEKITKHMSAIYRADRALEQSIIDAVEKYGAHGGMVFNAHNCGEEMVVGASKYTTAKFGYAVDPNNDECNYHEYGRELMNIYQQVGLSTDFKSVLAQMLDNGYYQFTTSDHPNTQMYYYYNADKVVDTLFFLAWSNHYITCYWTVCTRNKEGFSKQDISNMRLLSDQVRSHCEDAHG